MAPTLLTSLGKTAISMLKKNGIEFTHESSPPQIFGQIFITLPGFQKLLSYIDTYRLNEKPNELNAVFLKEFLNWDSKNCRELNIQHQPLMRPQTSEDGDVPAHSLMLYIPGAPPSCWVSAIQSGNVPFQDDFPTDNHLMGGALRLPTDETNWQLKIRLTNADHTILMNYKVHEWYKKIIVIEGTGRYKG